MYKKHLTPMIALLLLVLTPTVAFGAHYLLGYSSVDSGEIRWTSSTSYTSARDWAHDRWNGLGQINIAPDVWYTARDLDWRDTNDSSVNWVGLYSNYSWSYDTITKTGEHLLLNMEMFSYPP